MTMFNMTRDINGYNGFGLKFSENLYSATLTQLVTQTLTIPGEHAKWLAIFAYEDGATVWVADNATAAVPVGATIVATTSERNPIAREVKAGDVLSFITPDTTSDIGVALYALQ
jgi:hypothetical protein